MRILGIETSCDETAAAVVEDGTEVLSSVVASSQEMHAKYGGIIPEIAAREQVRVIIPVIHEALTEGNSPTLRVETPVPHPKGVLSAPLDAIAVTYGPGLIGSLLVGVETAKVLSWVWQKPLIKVNHLLAHIYGAFLGVIASDSEAITFPLVALVVSGGHTDLVLMKDHGKYQWLGGTRDDAAGEAFDKAARLLGLGYPGGPAIAKAADLYHPKGVCRSHPSGVSRLPRPMINSGDFDFSFSGLKTALRNLVYPYLTSEVKSAETSEVVGAPSLASEFQEAVTDVLVAKLISAGEKFKVKDLVLCGGVSANKRLREKMKEAAEKDGFRLSVPDFQYSTDNAAMVASCGYFVRDVVPSEKISPDPSLLL